MLDKLLVVLKDLPNELITIIIAALPVSELRGSIPIAYLTLKEPLLKTYFLSIIGNIVPVIPLLLFLRPLSEKLRHFRLWRRFFDYLFERTRKKAALVEKYEALGLILFVAIPLPVTGAWTGSIAASLFKIRFRYAFLSICLGVFIAGLIVSAVTIIGKGIFFKLFVAG
ncbi:MAG: small multi-drug export protein [Candidatus Omnitrophica bacterium]|nr:small multi-drug export protein [Candidatus Omnitrophota bacterium]